MSYNILILGSGGRESAIAAKLSQSPVAGNIFIAPGNGGTCLYGTNLPQVKPTDFSTVEKAVKEHNINLIIPGSEDSLVAGIKDYFQGQDNVLVLGPSKEGAQLEGSKKFAKAFMSRHNIPTAKYRSFNAETVEQGCEFLQTLKAPYVLKADGLAAGKGVLIIDSLEQAKDSLRQMLGGMFGAASDNVVIEEYLSGIECSVFVLTDGNGGYRILPVAKDYKRIGEGDTGPNTGGMGAVSPVAFADEEFMRKVEDRIIRPTVNGLRAENIPYCGFIFLGLMRTAEGDPYVIEYNVRMGDPETEVVMLRIKDDLLPAAVAAASGDLAEIPLRTDPRAATTVMMVAGGYPGSYHKGDQITIAQSVLDMESCVLYHAGTRRDAEGVIVTAGGRVIAASAMAPTVEEALALSYKMVEGVSFEGKYFRGDIGQDLLKWGK